MDSKNFAIGVLSTTAVILFVGLLVLETRPQPAYAASMNAQGGDYLVATGQLQDTEELLYVIDARNQVLVVYRFDINRKQINLTDRQDLRALAPASKPADQTADDSKDDSRRGRGRGTRR